MAPNSQVPADPKVSVIMPCYNVEKHIQKTVQSLYNQSFKDYELVLIDDGSTDNSRQLIKTLKSQHNNIITHLLDHNQGPGHARNTGIEIASANLIALLDADDLWHIEKLKIQYSLHSTTGCAFSCTGFKFGKTRILNGNTSYKSLLKNNVINTSSVMFDKNQVNIHFTSKEKSEDYAAWLDVAKKTKIHFINQPLVTRTVFDGVSANKFSMIKRRWQIYRNIEDLNFLRAVYFMINYALSGIIKYSKK